MQKSGQNFFNTKKTRNNFAASKMPLMNTTTNFNAGSKGASKFLSQSYNGQSRVSSSFSTLNPTNNITTNLNSSQIEIQDQRLASENDHRFGSAQDLRSD